MNIDLSNLLKERIHREVKSLYLEMIYFLEDQLEEEIINDSEFQRARKRILDRGNDAIRSLHGQVDEFEISFKQK